MKALPLPSSEAIVRRPLCRLTICLTMARPRPVPPVMRERAGSTREEQAGADDAGRLPDRVGLRRASPRPDSANDRQTAPRRRRRREVRRPEITAHRAVGQVPRHEAGLPVASAQAARAARVASVRTSTPEFFENAPGCAGLRL